MTYILLPQIEYNIRASNLKLTLNKKEENTLCINPSLKKYIEKIKSLIDENIDEGNKVYDYEAMAEEFENRLSKIVGVTVMCSVSEDITYE